MGVAFIEQAIAAGAVAVLARERRRPDPRVTTVKMPHARAALADMAAAFYQHPAQRLKMLGVTGTNGKTTTTFLIKHICEKRAAAVRAARHGALRDRRAHPARGADHAGDRWMCTSCSRRCAAPGCKAAVMEVSSHALAQDRVRCIEWDCAVFTNLTQDHLDYHGTMEKYFEAKSLLFTGLAGQKKKAEGGDQRGRPVRREADRGCAGRAGDDLRAGSARGFPRERCEDRFLRRHRTSSTRAARATWCGCR